jgi:hypothetical protein
MSRVLQGEAQILWLARFFGYAAMIAAKGDI